VWGRRKKTTFAPGWVRGGDWANRTEPKPCFKSTSHHGDFPERGGGGKTSCSRWVVSPPRDTGVMQLRQKKLKRRKLAA